MSRLSVQSLEAVGDLVSGQKDRTIALPCSEDIDQEAWGAGSDHGQLVNDPQHAVNAKPLAGSDFAEQGIARQDDPPISKCRNQTEAVVCRQGTVAFLESQGLSDLGRDQIVSDHALGIKELPLPVREVEEFRSPYGQWNDQSVRQVTKNPKQSPFAEVDQTGSVIGNDTGHWTVGPLICRSTASRGSLRSAAARTGEISSSPIARQTRRLKRRGFSNAPNP